MPSTIGKVSIKRTRKPLNNAVLTRGDDIELAITHVEAGQAGATLKLTAIPEDDYPNGTPYIIKTNSDFSVSISTNGNILTAKVTITSAETEFLPQRTAFVYDLERTVSSGTPAVETVTTLEQGRFIIDTDVTPN